MNPHWPPHHHGLSRDLRGPSLFPCCLFYCFALFEKQGFPTSLLPLRALRAISQMGGLTREITEPASRTQAFLTPNLGVLCHEKAAVTGLIQRPPERSEPRRLLCVPATQVSRPGGPTSCLTERGTAGVRLVTATPTGSPDATLDRTFVSPASCMWESERQM